MLASRDQVALVTGAGQGIGQAVTKKLAHMGYHVALTGRRLETLEKSIEVADAGHVTMMPFVCDLSRSEEIPGLVNRVQKEMGPVAVLINNAGACINIRVESCDLEETDKLFDLNVRATVHLTRMCIGSINAAKGGAVINIGSISGKMIYAGGAFYSASKHALMGFTGSLFEEVREHGTRVSVLCPGFVNTPMANGEHLDRDKMIQADDIADAVEFILNCGETVCPTEMTIRPQRIPYKTGG